MQIAYHVRSQRKAPVHQQWCLHVEGNVMFVPEALDWAESSGPPFGWAASIRTEWFMAFAARAATPEIKPPPIVPRKRYESVKFENNTLHSTVVNYVHATNGNNY
jgi:hypothetical protein